MSTEPACPPCQCKEPGWCERHQRQMTPHLFHLCQTREDYRRMWDAKPARPKRTKADRAKRTAAKKSPFSVGGRVVRYTKAVARWVKAGRPVRTPEEVARIYEESCRPCDDFDVEKETCKVCGCKVRKASAALVNKIGMATEHCPGKKW